MDETVSSKQRGRNRLVAPWSDDGWYAETAKRRTPPEIRAIIEREGRGKFNPVLYFDGRAAFAVSPAFHNPYLAFLVGVFFLGVAVLIFTQMFDVLWAAFAVATPFVIASGLMIFLSVRRVSAWHRARRAVRKYIAVHGGVFPPELRWYT